MSTHAFLALPSTPRGRFHAVPTRPLRIGLLTPHDPADRSAFSGSVHFAAKALAARPDVDLRILGRHSRPSRLGQWLGKTVKGPDLRTLDLSGLDAILGLVATSLLDRLPRHGTLPPVLHVTDATPAFLRDHYGLTVPETAETAERRVAGAAEAVIYSSSVMARRARQDLDLPGLAPDVLPFGANLDHVPPERPAKTPLDRIELLFVGLDWERKGGALAAAAAARLTAMGRDVRLTAVGRPPRTPVPGVTHLGFLDKNRPRDARLLSALMTQAHLLVLPTRADCTPMVIAEAMAHGTPAVASDTGGIAEMIGGAGAGLVLPLSAGPGDWARAIDGATRSALAWEMMSDTAFDRARSVLSWEAWAEGIFLRAAALADAAGSSLPGGNPATRKLHA